MNCAMCQTNKRQLIRITTAKLEIGSPAGLWLHPLPEIKITPIDVCANCARKISEKALKVIEKHLLET